MKLLKKPSHVFPRKWKEKDMRSRTTLVLAGNKIFQHLLEVLIFRTRKSLPSLELLVRAINSDKGLFLETS